MSSRCIQMALAATALMFPAAGPAPAQSDPARRVDYITSTFTFGWDSEDGWPTNPAQFDQLAGIVAEADFTTVLCNWASWKLPILTGHGLDMMVNVYGDDEYHILHDPDPVLALAASLKDQPGVWGYNVALDLTNLTSGYSNRLDQLHQADPNHPGLTSFQAAAWPYATTINDPDIISYYYYIWYTDGTPKYKSQFDYLKVYRDAALAEGTPLQQMPIAYQGPSVDGTDQKNRWSTYTALAYGVQGFHWFLADNWINASTFQWTSGGEGMKVVNAELKALGPELMRYESTAVYSTTTSLTAIGTEKDPGEPDLPYGTVAIPAGHWIQVESGEVLLGTFEDEATVASPFMVVNHRAHGSMDVTLAFDEEMMLVQIFNRQTELWEDVQIALGGITSVSFTLASGDGELLRAVPDVLFADANLDGKVDLQDFGALKIGYGVQDGGWYRGDFNRDYATDLQDLSILKAFYGQFQSPLGGAAIPEPVTAAALLAGFVLALRRKRVRL